MSTELFVILLLVAVVAVYAGLALRTYVRLRGSRVIVCPENDRPAAVTVDAAHAAVTAVWEKPELQLKTCSRWPEKQDCNQACTAQIAVAPQDTLTFELLKRWYAEKTCAVCRRPIEALHHGGPKPGMLNVTSPGHEIVTWEEIPAEALPSMFESHLPVCASCQVADAFRRQFPDMAIDRREHPTVCTSVH
jgi:hypothetical protein